MFYDCRKVRALGHPINILWGGRGIGKTYSALQMQIEDNLEGGYPANIINPFLYMRRMAGQAATVASKSLNPFKTLNRDMGIRLYGHMVSKTSVGEVCFCDDKYKAVSDPFAYAVALNTMGSMRGVDMADVDVGIFDEFMPTGKTDRMWAEEGTDFLNAYETFNRNREYFGSSPLQFFLLSNSTNIASPITDAFGVSDAVEKMVRDNKRTQVIGGVYLEFCEADISKYKHDTVLYKNAADKDFVAHALDNEFAYNNLSNIRPKVPLNEYLPYLSLDGIYIYRHKGRDELYACEIRSNAVTIKQTTERMFLAKFDMPLRRGALYGTMYYSNYRVKRKVLTLLKLI